MLPIPIEYLVIAIIIVIIGIYFLWQSALYFGSDTPLVILDAIGTLTGIVVWIGRRAKIRSPTSPTKDTNTSDHALFKSKLLGLIFVSVGFPLLVMGLFSYTAYQTQYDYVKARLADPNDSHTTLCDVGLLHPPVPCPLQLPTLSTSAILQIVEGGPLTIIGAATSVLSYSRYVPKPAPITDNPSTDGAPFG